MMEGIMTRFAALVLLACLAPGARADATVALNPVDGVISGAPGDTVGWGFTVTNGTNWISIDSVSVENETSPLGGASGGFTSYMDLLGGLTNGVTPPNQTWSLGFSPGSPGTGIGQYVIDAGTPLGASDSGDFVIFYDEFSGDPNTCGSCYVDTLEMFDAGGNPPAFTIDVAVTSVPEPHSALLLVLAGCMLALARRPSRRNLRLLVSQTIATSGSSKRASEEHCSCFRLAGRGFPKRLLKLNRVRCNRDRNGQVPLLRTPFVGATPEMRRSRTSVLVSRLPIVWVSRWSPQSPLELKAVLHTQSAVYVVRRTVQSIEPHLRGNLEFADAKYSH
jgi:hypothetical protein